MLSLFLISFLKSIFSLISCFEYLSSLSSGLSTSSSESISSFRLSRFTGEQVYNINIYTAENFTIMYIEVNAWFFLLVNFKINLILSLYQQKCIELNQSSVVWTTRTANQRSREIWNFARHLMSELLLVENWQGVKTKEKERIKMEIKSGYCKIWGSL